MVFDAALLNSQHYKVRIKGKVEQSGNRVMPSYTPWCSNYWKGSFLIPLDFINIYVIFFELDCSAIKENVFVFSVVSLFTAK